MPPPVPPLYAVGVAGVAPAQVLAVQVRTMATVKPPTGFEHGSTVGVQVRGREVHLIMDYQRVT